MVGGWRRHGEGPGDVPHKCSFLTTWGADINRYRRQIRIPWGFRRSAGRSWRAHHGCSNRSTSSLAFFVFGCASPKVFCQPASARRAKTSASGFFPSAPKHRARL